MPGPARGTRQQNRMSQTSINLVSKSSNLSAAAALHFATMHGNARATRALLAAGANPDGRDAQSNTALHIAATGGQTTVIELLLDAGADPDMQNRQGEAPLHHAATHGHADAVVALLRGGAEPSQKDKKGRTAKEVAGRAFASASRAASRRRVHQAMADFGRSLAAQMKLESRTPSADTGPAGSRGPEEQPAAGLLNNAPANSTNAGHQHGAGGDRPDVVSADQAVLLLSGELRELLAENNEALVRELDLYDVKGDGVIGIDDFKQGVARLLDAKLPPADATRLMLRLDKDFSFLSDGERTCRCSHSHPHHPAHHRDSRRGCTLSVRSLLQD